MLSKNSWPESNFYFSWLSIISWTEHLQNLLHESSLHLSYSSINFINTPYCLGRNSCVFPASIYENIIFIKCSPIFKFPYIFMFFPWTLCLWTFFQEHYFPGHFIPGTYCLGIYFQTHFVRYILSGYILSETMSCFLEQRDDWRCVDRYGEWNKEKGGESVRQFMVEAYMGRLRGVKKVSWTSESQ